MTERHKILSLRQRRRRLVAANSPVHAANQVIEGLREEMSQKDDEILEARKHAIETAKLLVKEREKNANH